MLSSIKQQVVDNVAARVYSRKLAVAKGELEGYACKLSGFQRALQELEMQLAEKELQVTMLKSFIRDSKDTVAPQQQLTQALQQNVQLLQELHHVVAAQSSTSSTTEPYPHCELQQQMPTWHMMQVAMLRKALTVANMRLTAAGMMPVAATNDLLQDEGFDVLPYAAPDQSASLAAHTPTTCEFAPPRMPSTGCSGISTSTSSGMAYSSSSQDPGRGFATSPDLTPLCLLRQLSGANIGEEGTPTPLAAEAERGSPSSRCSSPADLAEPTAAAAAAAAAAAGRGTPSGAASTAHPPSKRCARGSRWCCSSGSCCSSASKPANSAVAAAAAASTTAGSDDVAATATVDDENVASELSEEEELQHGCVYGDQGWGSSADAPVMDNPLFLLGSPASSPQRARPAVSL